MKTRKPRRADHIKTTLIETTLTTPKVLPESGPGAPAQPPTPVTVQPSGPAQPAARGIPAILAEGEILNGWIADILLPIVAALTTATGTALISEEVATAAHDGGWYAVFIVTLSWSLGSAIATYRFVSHPPKSWQELGGVAALSMVVAWGIATLLGVGVLKISMEELTHPKTHLFAHVLMVFASAATTAYGAVGAGLSAAIGIWLGARVAKHFPMT